MMAKKTAGELIDKKKEKGKRDQPEVWKSWEKEKNVLRK